MALPASSRAVYEQGASRPASQPELSSPLLLPYWILFAFFAAGVVLENAQRAPGQKAPRTYLLVVILLMTLMIGTRFKVGGD